jgi:hypothetical protein
VKPGNTSCMENGMSLQYCDAYHRDTRHTSTCLLRPIQPWNLTAADC